MLKTEDEKIEAGYISEKSGGKAKLSGFNMKDFEAKHLSPNIQRKKQITIIPAKKPNSQQFFRVHPSMQINVYVVDWKEENTLYIVHQEILEELFDQTKLVTLHAALFSSGSPFILPVPQPDESGKWNDWHRSLSEAVAQAKKKWIRLQPDRSINGYNFISAEGNLAEPIWPELTMEQYLSIAFKDTQIKSRDHPKIKELKGLA